MADKHEIYALKRENVALKKSVATLSEKLALLEQSVKNHRVAIDGLEEKITCRVEQTPVDPKPVNQCN